jgi:hypothetical protein
MPGTAKFGGYYIVWQRIVRLVVESKTALGAVKRHKAIAEIECVCREARSFVRGPTAAAQ